MALTDAPQSRDFVNTTQENTSQERVLGPKQRQRFNQIRQNEGPEAAAAFRQQIAERKGIEIGQGGPKPATFNSVGQQGTDVMSGFLSQIQGQEPFSLESFGAGPQATDFGEQRQEVIDAQMAEFERLMGPKHQQEQEQYAQALRNQGIPPGSEQFNSLMSDMSERQNNARLSAATQAIGLGGQEQNRMYGLASNARNQGLHEALMQYQMPMQQMNAMMPLYGMHSQQAHQNQTLGQQMDHDRWKTEYGGDIAKWQTQHQKHGPGYDVMALQGLRGDQAMQLQQSQFEQNLALGQQNTGQNKPPSSGSTAGSIGGAIAGGFAQGLGQGAFS
jgi:hypothetical protein